MPTYDELVLVANEDALERDGDKIRAFIAALARGTRALAARPGQADRRPARREPRPRPQAPARGGEGHAAAVPAAKGTPFGYQEPQAWQEFAAWMRGEQAGDQDPRRHRGFTNNLLPGAGL